jgi:hypothetical protein
VQSLIRQVCLHLEVQLVDNKPLKILTKFGEKTLVWWFCWSCLSLWAWTKNVDIKLTAHDVFLELPSSDIRYPNGQVCIQLEVQLFDKKSLEFELKRRYRIYWCFWNYLHQITCTLKAKIFESKIIWRSLGANKTKGSKQISKFG